MNLGLRRLAMMHRQNRIHVADAALHQRPIGRVREARYSNVAINEMNIAYADPDVGERKGQCGVYVSGELLTPAKNYFEVEVIDGPSPCNIVVGVGSYKHPVDKIPGCHSHSVSYCSTGKLYKGSLDSCIDVPGFEVGDKIGCRINFSGNFDDVNSLPVVFSKNGLEVESVFLILPMDGLYPIISLNNEGEEVRLDTNAGGSSDKTDVILMSIDNCEEDWSRLYDIRINGQMLEYTGRGMNITDVGLAQARHPLSTRYHYFEIQIINPGQNCYIAIGLARRDYPRHRHPGWNRGSIAYHADDGKIFVGSGIGEPFGPRCNKGDTMGCGIMFPRDYCREWDGVNEEGEEEEAKVNGRAVNGGFRGGVYEEGFGIDMIDYAAMAESESEDEEWFERSNGTKVKVFFTRNGVTVGKRDVSIPRGGFFPTIGMLSKDEKAHADLRPLTG